MRRGSIFRLVDVAMNISELIWRTKLCAESSRKFNILDSHIALIGRLVEGRSLKVEVFAKHDATINDGSSSWLEDGGLEEYTSIKHHAILLHSLFTM